MSDTVGTTPLCGHCGRPVLGQPAVFAGGVPYHIACSASPYGQIAKVESVELSEDVLGRDVNGNIVTIKAGTVFKFSKPADIR